MSKKPERLETKYYRLERLVKWDKIEQVNEMLMEGVSPLKVSEFCKDNGFSISHPKLYEYKEYLQTAISKQITVERLLGIGMPKRSAIQLQILGITDAKNMVKSEIDVLDAIVQRGFDALTQNPTVRLQDAMKAIELKQKLTGGAHAGLTSYGLDQLRAIETAKFQAMLEVVLDYVPEEKHYEIEEAIQNAERTYYEENAPDLLDEYEAQLQKEIEDCKTEDEIIVEELTTDISF